MLAINHSSNAHAAVRYFRENMAQVDYYSDKRAVLGKWNGLAADKLGLTGDVRHEDFEALLFNVDPNTGARLTARNSVNRRPMTDFTFNAPKSVSVMHAITKDDDIIAAHQLAVRDAMKEVEASLQTQMGSGKGKHYITTGNGLYAEFIHDTSRPLKREVDGKQQLIPDPHLHSHCALINATYCSEQGRFRAVELGNVKAHGAYFEALYHSFLAQNLKNVGYTTEREGKRWELAGMSREVIEKYSGRTLEIEARIEKDGLVTAKQKAAVGRLTRNDKNTSIEDGKLHGVWKDRLTLSEYHSIMSAKGSDPNGGSGGQTADLQMTAEKAIDLSLQHFLERNSGVPERKVLAHAIDLGSGIVSAGQIKKEMASRENIIRADYRTVSYITTTDMLAEENGLIQKAVAGKNNTPALNPEYSIQNDMLNEGQRGAIEHILTSNDKIMMVSGDAGTGKTTMLLEVKKAIEQRGKKMMAFAPSSQAAEEVLQKKGFDGATTIAKLLGSPELQEQLKGNVMLVDEAGLVGIPTMNALFDLAEKHKSRIVLSGDYKQHSAVERGDATRVLDQKAGLTSVNINEIVRQNKAEKFKEVVASLAAGVGVKKDQDKRAEQVTKAFDKLDKQGAVIEITDPEQRQKALASDYVKEYSDNLLGKRKSDKNSVLVVSPTHREGKEITAAIREEMRNSGLIGEVDKTFTRLKSRSYTDAEKQLAQSYSKGDTVQFHQNVSGFRAGERLKVHGIDENRNVLGKRKGEIVRLNMSHSAHFDVFAPEKIGLATGDKIRITKNTKSSGGSTLLNGQTYQVNGFDLEGNIQLSNGQTLHKKAGHFNHGYVSTSHAAQGQDAKTVLIAQSSQSFGASNDKQFYVSVSRAKQNCKVYTDDKAALRTAISRSGDRMSAGEVADLAQQKQKQSQKTSYVMRVQQFYSERIKPTIQQQKENHEQRRTEREMGNPQLGLDRG